MSQVHAPTGYSRTQIALHWGIAALIIGQFVLHDPIVAAWEAHVIHWSLYALMIVLPLTGMATWFGGSTLADTVHTSLKFPLLLLFALHVLAALFQQFVLKTGLMRRMTRAQP